jgi:hypothetical protein
VRLKNPDNINKNFVKRGSREIKKTAPYTFIDYLIHPQNSPPIKELRPAHQS